MSSGRRKFDKNLASIIVAIIGIVGTIITVVGTIVVAYIGKHNDCNVNKISKNNSSYSKYITVTSVSRDSSKDNITGDTLKVDIFGGKLKDNPEDNSINISENKIENSGNNSGVIISGTNSGSISVFNNDYSDSNDEKQYIEEKVTLTGEISKTIVYGENNEIIDTYYDNTSIPICDFKMTNGNKEAIDIKNVFVEVIDCNIFDRFIDDSIPPLCWATMEKKIFWSCNISPESKRYQSILLGYDENGTEDLSKTEYVNIGQSNTGQFILKMYPDIPGEYVINVIVEYIISGKEVEIVLPNMKFTYDPNTEYGIEPSLDIIDDIDFFY